VLAVFINFSSGSMFWHVFYCAKSDRVLSIHSGDKRYRDVASISKIRVVLPACKQQVCCAVRR